MADQLTTEEEIRKIFKSPYPGSEEENHVQIDRLVDLFVDLITERSEEKAEEIIENHKIDYDHDLLYERQ